MFQVMCRVLKINRANRIWSYSPTEKEKERERGREREVKGTRYRGKCDKGYCWITKKGSVLPGVGHYFFPLCTLRNISTLYFTGMTLGNRKK